MGKLDREWNRLIFAISKMGDRCVDLHPNIQSFHKMIEERKSRILKEENAESHIAILLEGVKNIDETLSKATTALSDSIDILGKISR